MKRTLAFLERASIFYLSKIEEEAFNAYPFNAVAEFEGRLYISTYKAQNFCDSLQNNAEVEISCITNGEWLRLTGEVKQEHRDEVKKAFMQANPSFKKAIMTHGEPKILYFTKGIASFCTIDKEPIIEHLA